MLGGPLYRWCLYRDLGVGFVDLILCDLSSLSILCLLCSFNFINKMDPNTPVFGGSSDRFNGKNVPFVRIPFNSCFLDFKNYIDLSRSFFLLFPGFIYSSCCGFVPCVFI